MAVVRGSSTCGFFRRIPRSTRPGGKIAPKTRPYLTGRARVGPTGRGQTSACLMRHGGAQAGGHASLGKACLLVTPPCRGDAAAPAPRQNSALVDTFSPPPRVHPASAKRKAQVRKAPKMRSGRWAPKMYQREPNFDEKASWRASSPAAAWAACCPRRSPPRA